MISLSSEVTGCSHNTGRTVGHMVHACPTSSAVIPTAVSGSLPSHSGRIAPHCVMYTDLWLCSEGSSEPWGVPGGAVMPTGERVKRVILKTGDFFKAEVHEPRPSSQFHKPASFLPTLQKAHRPGPLLIPDTRFRAHLAFCY